MATALTATAEQSAPVGLLCTHWLPVLTVAIPLRSIEQACVEGTLTHLGTLITHGGCSGYGGTGACAEIPSLGTKFMRDSSDDRSAGAQPAAVVDGASQLERLMADRGAHHTSPLGIVHFHMQQFLLDERRLVASSDRPHKRSWGGMGLPCCIWCELCCIGMKSDVALDLPLFSLP